MTHGSHLNCQEMCVEYKPMPFMICLEWFVIASYSHVYTHVGTISTYSLECQKGQLCYFRCQVSKSIPILLKICVWYYVMWSKIWWLNILKLPILLVIMLMFFHNLNTLYHNSHVERLKLCCEWKSLFMFLNLTLLRF